MTKAPNLLQLAQVIKLANHTQTEINGKWVPARPLGLDTIPNRLRLAWLVFTGKADAIVWPGGQ